MNLPDHGPAAESLQRLTRLQPAIQGYALALTADHQLAEDVYQEVAAIVSADPKALPAGDGALAWSREVARRKALELTRGERRERRVLSDGALDELAVSFTVRADSNELASRLARCVEQLAHEHRTILSGRYHENLSAEEISRRVGRSVQGVYAVLKRVRRVLARCMRASVPRLAPGADREEHGPDETRGEHWNEVLS